MKSFLSIAALAGVVAAQVPAWGQCGGQGYTGSTVCASGYTCVVSNPYYSQCLPSSSSSSKPVPTTLKTTTTVKPSTTTSKTTTTVKPSTTTITTTIKPSTTTTTTKPSSTSSPATFRFLGRVNPATNELTWPGTGVSFTFTGTSATINFSSVTGTNSADLIIDGGAPIDISSVTGTSVSTPAGLAQGTHTVQFIKRSEALYGSIFIQGVTTTGTLVADKVPTRQIELIGDSISVGYGLDGVLPCTNNASVEDEPLTYGALTAQAVGADFHDIAWSGKGIVRNYASTPADDSLLLPELWTRYGANDADNSYTFPASWQPQAVVINIGTNDFSYLNVRSSLNITLYTNDMVAFVNTIKTHYPNAQFFLLTSPMLSDGYPAGDAQHTTQLNALQAAATQIGASAHVVDWPAQGSAVGCDYHPNADTHAAGAAILTAAIESALGW